MDVRALQRFLLAAGFDPGEIDGQFGQKTERALKAWQASRGLLADGVVGPATRSAMIAAGLAFAVLTVTSRCVDLIKAWEGLEDGNPATAMLDPYPDPVGIWTVGWGHALQNPDGSWCRTRAQAEAAMLRLFGAKAITRDQAKALLATDINVFLGRLTPMLAGVATTQDQLDALVSFAFNVGAAGFEGSTLRKRHAAGVKVSASIDYGLAKTMSQRSDPAGPMEHAFGAWSKSGKPPKWFRGLWRRRMCEAMAYRGDDLNVALARAGAMS